MSSEQKKRAVKVIAVLLGVAALLLFMALVLRPPCLIYKLTGFYCPACGSQRMVAAILRGDISAAFGYNQFMLFVLLVIGIYCVCEALRYVKEKPLLCRTKGFLAAAVATAVCAVAFAVLRNIPGLSFLAPH